MWRSCGRVASKGQTEFRYLMMTGACLSSKEERVVLYAIKREPNDLGG